MPRSRFHIKPILKYFLIIILAPVLIFVLLCAGTGVTLAILPWSLQWTDNYLLLRFPFLQPFVTNGFVRGICTGLGLLDLWIGFAEAVHYHEEKPAQK